MKHIVVVAAAFGLAILAGWSSEKHDKAAEAPPAVQVVSEGGVNFITVDRPERFPVTTATLYATTSTLKVTGAPSIRTFPEPYPSSH